MWLLSTIFLKNNILDEEIEYIAEDSIAPMLISFIINICQGFE
jgi:hypothetical protein